MLLSKPVFGSRCGAYACFVPCYACIFCYCWPKAVLPPKWPTGSCAPARQSMRWPPVGGKAGDHQFWITPPPARCFWIWFPRPAQLARLADEVTNRRGLVPHTLELRHAGLESRSPARLAGVGGDRAALVASLGLALEADQTGSQRQRSTACPQTGPHPLDLGNLTAPAGPALC